MVPVPFPRGISRKGRIDVPILTEGDQPVNMQVAAPADLLPAAPASPPDAWPVADFFWEWSIEAGLMGPKAPGRGRFP